jgi:D-amino-acid dehydrogenase
MDVIVVGAGIVGMFASYYLAKDGHSVTMIDMDAEGGQTSIHNGGLIVPSFAATPPIGFRKILGPYIGRQGPVYVSPVEALRNVSWLGAIGRARRSERSLTEFGKESLELYKEFLSSHRIEVDLTKGVVGLYEDAHLAEEAAYRLNGRFLDRDEAEQEGFRGFGGGVLFEELALNPLKLHYGLRNAISEMGVKILLGKRAQLRGSPPVIESALVDGRPLNGETFVLATGAWSRSICKSLGYDPHIVPGRGLKITFATGGWSIIKHAALLEDYGIAVNQNNSNTLTATGFFELRGFQRAFSQSRRKWLIDILGDHLIKAGYLKYVGEGVGYRPCTYDQLPVIGRIPRYENLLIASGHCRLGLTLAPATGRMVAAIIADRGHGGRWSLFDPCRFGGKGQAGEGLVKETVRPE